MIIITHNKHCHDEIIFFFLKYTHIYLVLKYHCEAYPISLTSFAVRLQTNKIYRISGISTMSLKIQWAKICNELCYTISLIIQKLWICNEIDHAVDLHMQCAWLCNDTTSLIMQLFWYATGLIMKLTNICNKLDHTVNIQKAMCLTMKWSWMCNAMSIMVQ